MSRSRASTPFITKLIEFASAMGRKVVCAGKGKNDPLHIDATPDAYRVEASDCGLETSGRVRMRDNEDGMSTSTERSTAVQAIRILREDRAESTRPPVTGV